MENFNRIRKSCVALRHGVAGRKMLAVTLAVALTFALALTGCGEAASGDGGADLAPAPDFAIGALKGPTGMGLCPMMEDYSITLAGSADELTPQFIQGDLDIICVPANLAAVLYNRLEGDVCVLDVNTLGVIYVVDTDGSIGSLEDLRGRTIVGAGKGSTPEYALDFLLTQAGLDPATDVDIQWKSEHAECVSALATGQAQVALLPQPFVTVASAKIPGLEIGLDLTAEWDALGLDSSLITGVTIARKSAIEGREADVDRFLADCAAAVEYMNGGAAETAAGADLAPADLVEQYIGIDAGVAAKALPYCNIVCLAGGEMKTRLAGYLEVLFEANPQSVGGALPGEDFYY